MPLIERIRKVAIDEVISPTFDLTKQFLHANKLLYEDGVPVIEDIILDEEGADAEVFFPVLDEKYYFFMYIDTNEPISPRLMGMSAGNKVVLTVLSEERLLPELLEQLDIVPSDTWEKGQPMRANATVFNKTSGFRYALTTKKTGDAEDKVKAMTEFLMPQKDRMVQLAKIATAWIGIAYFGYKGQMWGLHFDAEIISAVAELGLSIDVDIYASGPDLP